MPVFHCSSCQRLLYRPDEFLGRAWQCPNCGPVSVCEEAVPVSPELAALLEKEYRLGLSGGPSAVQTKSVKRPVPPVRSLKVLPTPRKKWHFVIATVTAVAIFALVMGIGTIVPIPFPDYFLYVGSIAALGGMALGTIGAAVCLLIELRNGLRRRRWIRMDDSLPGTLRSSALSGTKDDGDQHIERRNEAVSPEATPNDTTELQNKRSDGH